MATVSDSLPEASSGLNFTIIDSFNYPDNLSARKHWQARWDSAPVEAVKADRLQATSGAANVTAFPCNFKGRDTKRATWDREIELDLAGSEGLTFKILCPDTTPISGFNLYLRSSTGWYSMSFDASSSSEWETVILEKSDSRTEGNPAGWSRIDRIRISAWRGNDIDTVFYMSDLAAINSQSEIVLIRSDSVSRNLPGEQKSVQSYTANVAHFLKNSEISFSMMSDNDVTAASLNNKKLAILPYNPALINTAMEALDSFMDNGGKLLCFYIIPGQLQVKAGIRTTKHRKTKYTGEFSFIRPVSGRISGLPDSTGQQSWNIHQAKPLHPETLVVAQWYDKNARNTGEPAILASDNCIFMSHVLLKDDPVNKKNLLLAMTGHFVPSVWKQAANSAIAEAGNYHALLNGTSMQRNPDNKAAFTGEASILSKRAAELFKQGKYSLALNAAEKARAGFLKSYCAAQPPQPGEHKAIWCHSPFGVEGLTWDETARLLADNGFNVIMPNMCWGGVAFYESKILPIADSARERGDQIAACVEACRKNNIGCHIWKVNFNMGRHAPPSFVQRMKNQDRIQKDDKGEFREKWLCPSHPANATLEINAMLEIVSNYDVDGIHFDYIRYPGNDCCFCNGCHERFEEYIGAKIKWPEQALTGRHKEKWMEFRRLNITRIVSEVSSRARKIKPGIKISAAVFSNWPSNRDSIGQDWQLWCEKGYLDFVCPMNYTQSTSRFQNLVRLQKNWAANARLYPGIGLSTWNNPTDAISLIEKIRVTRRLQTGGFTVFQLDPAFAKEILPLCGLGITTTQ